MILFSDEKGCSIEEIPEYLTLSMQTPSTLKIPTSQARKIESMSLPKQLCVYK